MTNEQLAELIKQGNGENDDLLPLLWDKTHRFVYMCCSRLYLRDKAKFEQHGVEEWDLKQEAYSGFLKAVQAYDPEKGFKFTSFLPLQLQRVVRSLIGVSDRNPTDALNAADSLNKIIPAGEDDTEQGDLVPDPAAQIPFEEIEAQDMARIVHETVNTLPERERDIIQKHYFEEKSLTSIGEETGISAERVRQIKRHALRTLERSKRLRDLRDDYITYKHRSAATCLRLGSTVETDVERREAARARFRR